MIKSGLGIILMGLLVMFHVPMAEGRPARQAPAPFVETTRIGNVPIYAIHLLPDGTTLGVAHEDGFRFYDLLTGRLVRFIAGLRQAELREVSWSPDGTLFATASDEEFAHVWDATTGELLWGVKGVKDNAYGAAWLVAWSPDGTRLAVGGNSDPVQMWDVARRELMGKVAEADSVNRLAWSPDGTRLVTAAFNAKLRVWDTATGQLVHDLVGHTESVIYAVAWSPDGTRLASVGQDHTVRIWDTATGQSLKVLEGHTDAVRDLAWSPDGAWLVTTAVGDDHTFRIWDVEKGTTLVTKNSDYGFRKPLWSPDGSRLVIAGDYDLTVWEAATDEFLGIQVTWGSNLAWSSDSTRLIFDNWNHELYIWEAATGETLPVREQVPFVSDLSWSPDGANIAVFGNEASVQIWNIATERRVTTLAGYRSDVTKVQWSLDGTRILAESIDYLAISDVTTGLPLVVFADFTQTRDQTIQAADWSPDRSKVAASVTGNIVQVWDAATGEVLTTLAGYASSVTAVAWSPDGSRLATGTNYGVLQIVDLTNGTAPLEWETFNSTSRLAWSPDGTRLAALHRSDKRVSVWDAGTGTVLGSLESINNDLRQLAWSPDGVTLAVQGDLYLHLWDGVSPKPSHVLPAESDSWHAMAWSPDGTRLAYLHDSSVRMWEASSGESYLAIAQWHWEEEIFSVAWSPDGSQLAINAKNQIRLWAAN